MNRVCNGSLDEGPGGGLRGLAVSVVGEAGTAVVLSAMDEKIALGQDGIPMCQWHGEGCSSCALTFVTCR